MGASTFGSRIVAQIRRNEKVQDRPQQARQQIPGKGRVASKPSIGQRGKRPLGGGYDRGLDCEGSPATNPTRARKTS